MKRFTAILYLVVLIIAFFALPGHAEREKIERIAAVVGDKVILASEVANQMQIRVLQSGQRPRSDAEVEQLKTEVLEEMINEQLFLQEAKKDTSISVRPEEVDQSLEEQIARVSGRFDSQQEFIDALSKEGLTLRELKRRYRTDIENQMLKQRLIQTKLSTVSVSRHEVEQFYEKFKDSLPAQPEGVRLAHILLSVKASPQAEDSVKALASELRQKILDGADFATIASNYSSMGAGANGGDIGFVGRDDVVPEFARAAFALAENEVSGVVRTQFGYHVIRNEGRDGDRLHLRHVLLAVTPSAVDSTRTMQLADSLLTLVRSGGDFDELAKAYSEDNDTRATGGELGWFAIQDLPEAFAGPVAGWTTAGEYKGPITSPYGIHILKLLEYQPAKEYTLQDDYDRIREFARQDKTGKLVDKWIAEIRQKTFVEYRLEA